VWGHCLVAGDGRWRSTVSHCVRRVQLLRSAASPAGIGRVPGQTPAADALIDQEYYCSFEAAILGAYWGKEMLLAEQQGRIS
jgi:hypothetical protein